MTLTPYVAHSHSVLNINHFKYLSIISCYVRRLSVTDSLWMSFLSLTKLFQLLLLITHNFKNMSEKNLTSLRPSEQNPGGREGLLSTDVWTKWQLIIAAKLCVCVCVSRLHTELIQPALRSTPRTTRAHKTRSVPPAAALTTPGRR